MMIECPNRYGVQNGLLLVASFRVFMLSPRTGFAEAF